MRDNSFREQRRELRRERRAKRREENMFKGSGSVLAGLVILCVGTAFLLREMDVNLPKYLFTWPMILVVFGIFVGAGNSFRDPGWLVLSGVGVVFLMRYIWPGIPVWNYTWPVIIIIIGLMMILSPRRKHWVNRSEWGWGNDKKPEGEQQPEATANTVTEPVKPTDSSNTYTYTYTYDDRDRRIGDNLLDTVTVFGNVKKQVYAKDFRGGEIVSIFGGAEINLMQADFNGRIHIEMVQIFAGAKLIVPPHWQIRSEMAVIFGGIEDKRPPQASYDENKVVILTGTTLFGGIEIKSF